MTGLKANHVCQAIRRVVNQRKATREIHKFRPTSISLDARTFRYIEPEQAVGITLKESRANFGLKIGGDQIALLRGQTPKSATLSKTRQGGVISPLSPEANSAPIDYYINIVVEVLTQPKHKTPKVLGVDVGLRDIATTSTGNAWDGKQLRETRARFARTRASIQRGVTRRRTAHSNLRSKRTKSSKRLLRRLSGRERRFQKWVHNISKQLVEEAKELGAIAFEDLTGIRQRAKVRKSQRREHHSWSFYQLRLLSEYKAAIAGVDLILVDPRYTSKTCHCCKVIGNRDKKVFRCINANCRWVGDADHNGALNISALGGCFVNQPGILTMFCSLQDCVRDKAPSESLIQGE